MQENDACLSPLVKISPIYTHGEAFRQRSPGQSLYAAPVAELILVAPAKIWKVAF